MFINFFLIFILNFSSGYLPAGTSAQIGGNITRTNKQFLGTTRRQLLVATTDCNHKASFSTIGNHEARGSTIGNHEARVSTIGNHKARAPTIA